MRQIEGGGRSGARGRGAARWLGRMAALGVAVWLLGGCFGRSAPAGLGLGTGAQGDLCRRDVDCLPGLSCLDGACVPPGTSPPEDAASDPTSDGSDAVATTDQSADPDASPECPDLAGTLTLGTPASGSTTGRADRQAGSCGGQGAPDDVWALDVATTTSLSVRTLNAAFDTVLYVRKSCGGGQELACNDDDPLANGTNSRVVLNNLAPGRYYVFVDGFGQGSGSYEVLAEVVNGS